MAFLVFVVFIILFVRQQSTNKRVTRVEEMLNRSDSFSPAEKKQMKQTMYDLATDDAIEDTPRPIQGNGNPIPIPAAATLPIEQKVIPPISSPQPETEDAIDMLSWFRDQTLIKVGSIIFFLGTIWFVSYAIEQNWITPIFRIVLGLLLACAVYSIGIWRSKIDVTQYQTLTILGTGIFLGTTIASQFAFQLPVVPAGLAFSLMLLSVGYTLYVAIQTKAQWLAIIASVAGLCVPFLINANEPRITLVLIYGLLLSAGFLGVVFYTNWRKVTMTLLLGTAIYLLTFGQSDALTDNVLWLFVVLFSALFCASATVSILRTDTPKPIDMSILSLTAMQLIIYTMAVATFPALALFVAGAITAGIGYLLLMRNSNTNSISLYAAISLLLILVGTAELFDGFVLTIAYAIEVLAVFSITLKVAQTRRYVYVASALFLLPVISGLSDFASNSWESGVFHPEALGTLSVILTLGTAVLWILRAPVLMAIDWIRGTAGALLTLWLAFATITCFQIGFSLAGLIDEDFVITILLTYLAIFVIGYILYTVRRNTWRIWIVGMLLAPTVSAMSLLGHASWSDGISHLSFLATLTYFVVIAILAVLFWQQSKKENNNALLSNLAYGFVWLLIGYGFLFLSTVWSALITAEASRVVTSISYTFLIYIIVNALMIARVAASRIVAVTAALIVPTLFLVGSLHFGGWVDGLFGIDAIGLYITCTVFILLGITLTKYQTEPHVPDSEKSTFTLTSLSLFMTAGVIAYALVWIMSQTAFSSSNTAVVVALFIYTVAGLAVYTFGRTLDSSSWKRVGVVLLTTVILRLALVDVWVMEMVWRIVTFLGIGLLFIITALLERSHEKTSAIDSDTKKVD